MVDIKTKFNLEDTVWFMKDNKPTEAIVSCVQTFNVGTNQDHIKYSAKDVIGSVSWLDHQHLHEYMLFKTKDELMDSLFKTEMRKKKVTCKGKNCKAVNGLGHSDECIKEHEDCINYR